MTRRIEYIRNNNHLFLGDLANILSCNTVDIEDMAEDSVTGEDFLKKVNAQSEYADIYGRFDIDRETFAYVRLKRVDKLGNNHYLIAYK